MPQTHKDQVFDADGNVVQETDRVEPARVVSEDQFRQLKRDLRAHRQLPTPLSAGQTRQWLITLSQAISFLGDETDAETE